MKKKNKGRWQKSYKCKNCGKVTSTTDKKIYEEKLCQDCRPTSRNMRSNKPVEQKAWTKWEKGFVAVFLAALVIAFILCMLGILPGC